MGTAKDEDIKAEEWLQIGMSQSDPRSNPMERHEEGCAPRIRSEFNRSGAFLQ